MNTLRKLAHALVCASALLMSQGCLTMFGRSNVDVPVTTTPPGMSVRTSDGATKITPCVFELDRTRDHMLTLSDPQGKVLKAVEIRSEESVLRWLGSLGLNTLCHGWLTNGISSAIGVAVDASAGSTRKLEPDTVQEDFTGRKAEPPEGGRSARDTGTGDPGAAPQAQATPEPARRRVAGP